MLPEEEDRYGSFRPLDEDDPGDDLYGDRDADWWEFDEEHSDRRDRRDECDE